MVHLGIGKKKGRVLSYEHLHKRSDLHLLRKFFHICMGLVLLYPFYCLDKGTEWMAAILGVCLAFVLFVEYIRQQFPLMNHFFIRILGSVMRVNEVEKTSGVPFYLASCLFAILVFPRDIAILATLHLILGDPSSSFFGILFGKDRLFVNKSLQGTLGGFFICSIVTAFYLYHIDFERDSILLFSMIGGVCGSVAELLPLNVDDNFSIPIVSGFAMYLSFWSAGFL